jgi:hypothetical protein
VTGNCPELKLNTISLYHSESTMGSPVDIEIIPSKESLFTMRLHKLCPLTSFKGLI